MFANIVFLLLWVLPKNLLSYLFGRIAAIRWPSWLNQKILAIYAKRYHVNLAEASQSLADYPSLANFFIRDLSPGVRTIGEGVVSPVDGRISEFGAIVEDTLLQAKGHSYSVSELLGESDQAQRFIDGYYVTLYLAPGDYHHIHSPADAELIGYRAIPGTLWPVNEISVQKIPRLFAKNERVITFLETKQFGVIAVVKVGATNVGSISLAYDQSLRTNTYPCLWRKCLQVRENNFSQRWRIFRGERIATFHLGSTVILLFEKGKFSPGGLCRKGQIRYGEQLNEMR